jgi:hypothetical protein
VGPGEAVHEGQVVGESTRHAAGQPAAVGAAAAAAAACLWAPIHCLAVAQALALPFSKV